MEVNSSDRIGLQPGQSNPTPEWFLGYNAACSTCASIEEVVRGVADGKLETVNLHDPIVKVWQFKALGADAPFAPTLFRVQGQDVKAWVGKRMLVKLSFILGPRKSQKLAQSIAEISAAGPATSRRTFTKRLLASFLAIGGSGALATATLANDYEPPEEPISEDEAARQDSCTAIYSGSITSPTKTLAYPSLTLRAQPCTSSAAIASIPCNTWVGRISYHDQPVYIYNPCVGENRRRWYKVTYGASTGYIASVYTTAGLGYDPGCC